MIKNKFLDQDKLEKMRASDRDYFDQMTLQKMNELRSHVKPEINEHSGLEKVLVDPHGTDKH